MKKIVFRKTDSKFDYVEYFDSDKCVARLENPKQGILPHDLIHALVESSLGIRGFTALIFSGNKPEFAMNADGEAWLSESMVEAVQGMLWSGHLVYDQFCDWVQNICARRSIAPLEINEAQFSRLGREVERYTRDWINLKSGEFLEFEWPSTELG